tara:strand:- start:20901 stop:21632 length:732 start_codon:yes stop_codon:yes gene_type:complete
MIETKKRTLLKAICWKLIGFFCLTFLGYIFTGSFKVAGLIALAQFIVTFLIYAAHERIWARVSWGKTRGISIQMTGMSGAGKSTISKIASKNLIKKGYLVEVIDGDEYRESLCKDLGFTKPDRNANIRRLSFVSKVLSRNNIISIIAAINPYENIREENKIKDPTMKTVYIKCDLGTLFERDTKGMYARASLPENHPEKIENFTGISDPFEEPKNPDLVLDTSKQTVSESAKIFEKFIINQIS